MGCESPNPNIGQTGEDGLKALEIPGTLKVEDQEYQDLIYVPIYCRLYVDKQDPIIRLSATLSIRNTSSTDSLFISKIDYFDTHGDLIRSYIEHTISLPPMATINYVIEKEDDIGGTGTNFLVDLSAKNPNIKPLIQAIMVGHSGSNKGFSFSTDGYSVR